MPDFTESNEVVPRRPQKTDYVYSRQFRQPMSLACRLYQAGYRRPVPQAVWKKFVRGSNA